MVTSRICGTIGANPSRYFAICASLARSWRNSPSAYTGRPGKTTFSLSAATRTESGLPCVPSDAPERGHQIDDFYGPARRLGGDEKQSAHDKGERLPHSTQKLHSLQASHVGTCLDPGSAVALAVPGTAARVKYRQIVKIIEDDGWRCIRPRGSHGHYKHPIKRGVVTIAGHLMGHDVPPLIVNSILKQAGLKK